MFRNNALGHWADTLGPVMAELVVHLPGGVAPQRVGLAGEPLAPGDLPLAVPGEGAGGLPGHLAGQGRE